MNFRISIKHKDEGKHVQTIFLRNVEMTSSDVRILLDEIKDKEGDKSCSTDEKRDY